MNPTEGSQRERRRLERATRRIKSKFFRKTNSEDDSSNITHDHENASFPLEQFLKEDPAEGGFHFRWLIIKEIDAAFSISLTLISNHLKWNSADTHAVIEWLHTHEKIYKTEKCRRITPEHESHGEFLIAKGTSQHIVNILSTLCQHFSTFSYHLVIKLNDNLMIKKSVITKFRTCDLWLVSR